jgi:hypothetical protein
MNSIEQSENMLVFKKIHDECREIFKGDRELSEKLNAFNEYLNNYLNTDNNGIMRTLLVIGKAFKDNPIVKDNLEFLANKLRTNLNVKFI